MARRRARGDGSVEQTPLGRWRIRWYTSDGRHPSRTFDTEREARAALRAYLVDAERDGIELSRRDETLDGVIDRWWSSTERSVKPRTAERYLNHVALIRRRLGSRPVGELDYAALQDFVDDLSSEYAPKTVVHCYGVLALILRDGVARGKLRPIPKPRMPRVAKPRLTIPTREQVEAVALASDARLHAAVVLAGYCGLRQGELLALHRSDVDLDAGFVFVHRARNKSTGELESTKTDAVRRVYYPAPVAGVLAAHLLEYPGDVVFPVSASVADKSWRRARESSGIGSVRFHDLRHAAASMMIAAGLSVLQVAKQLGHANPTQTLDTYGHLFPDSFADAVDRMNRYLDHD